MQRYVDAWDYLDRHQPDHPVLFCRPQAVKRAGAWFARHFAGATLYAIKANDSDYVIGQLYGAGIHDFDVSSLPEIERVAHLPGVTCYLMNPVKSRALIRTAYQDYGLRNFSFDSLDELEKIFEETGGAKDLSLHLRIAVANDRCLVPLDRKFGAGPETAEKLLVEARRIADRLGVCFHVGSQNRDPSSFADALDEAGDLVVRAGVKIDMIDVGGGFPTILRGDEPGMFAYFGAIQTAFQRRWRGGQVRLLAEPGRALAAEAESLLVQVLRRDGLALTINDGVYGNMFEAADCYCGMSYPVKLLGAAGRDQPAGNLQPFKFWGPTCDSIDEMSGPFMIPDDVREGDYLEIENIGAYGRVSASRFNGYGYAESVELVDYPTFSMYGEAALAQLRNSSLDAAE